MKIALSVITCFFTASAIYAQEVPAEAPAPSVPEEQKTAPAEAATPAPEASQLTEQDVLKEMTGLLSKLITTLSTVRDDASAAASANEIAGMMETLFSAEYPGVDEEEVAAGLTDLFNDLELQVSRLYESDFYGNATLKKTFGAEEEPFTPPPGKDDEEPEDVEYAPEEDEDESLNEPD